MTLLRRIWALVRRWKLWSPEPERLTVTSRCQDLLDARVALLEKQLMEGSLSREEETRLAELEALIEAGVLQKEREAQARPAKVEGQPGTPPDLPAPVQKSQAPPPPSRSAK